jgi:hypothetical protein
MKILGRVGTESYPSTYIVQITINELRGLRVELEQDVNPGDLCISDVIEKRALMQQQNYKVRDLIEILSTLRM